MKPSLTIMVAQSLFRTIVLSLSTRSLVGWFTSDIVSILSSLTLRMKKEEDKKSQGRNELSSASPPGCFSGVHGTNTIVEEGTSLNTDHSKMILVGSIPISLSGGNKQNSKCPSSPEGPVSVSVGNEARHYSSSSGSFGKKKSTGVSTGNNVRNEYETRRRRKRIHLPNEEVNTDSFHKPNLSNSNSKVFETTGKNDGSVTLPDLKPFDICPTRPKYFGKTGAPSVAEKPSDVIVLRSGMVLLKHFISHKEQVEIVKTTHKLGLGPGGFYQPFYRDGAKLRLQMMCLGRNWDPETKYTIKRSIDGCEPLCIPSEFTLLVRRAIQCAHNCIQKDNILPPMVPDICIVNFYTTRGKLGLHQDRDESKESLRKGLPVVSFSIGDSAEFLFGNQRDLDKADRILLESGDVLIFGGESRLVYHGVSSIIPNSAPKFLLNDTGLRPGRLNLTFRQF